MFHHPPVFLPLLFLFFAASRASFSAADYNSTGIRNSCLSSGFQNHGFCAFYNHTAPQTLTAKRGSQNQVCRVTSPSGVLWLGESMNVFSEEPTGYRVWMGIPTKHGFRGFMEKVEFDLNGYPVEAYDKEMKTLPDQIPFDLVQLGDGYDHYLILITQYYKEFHFGWAADVAASPGASEFTDYMEAASLSLTSFYGLFIVIGLTSLIALVVTFVLPFCRHTAVVLRETCAKHLMMSIPSYASVTASSTDVKFYHKISRLCMFMVVMTLVTIMAMHYISIQTPEEVKPIPIENSVKRRIGVPNKKDTGKFKIVVSNKKDRGKFKIVVSNKKDRDMKIKIVVPVKKGFKEFIEVYHHPKDDRRIARGFVADVFEEVIKALPYRVSYQFIPYEIIHQDAIVYYDKLIFQLSLKENGYDGVMGDITMTANRSKYGDFSLPFMSSEVSMIVPKDDGSGLNSLWWFFKPLSAEMWLVTFAFFLLKGILIWFLEHRTNREFQGTTSEQVGTIVTFSFSIFLSPQKAKLERMSSKFIIDLWGLMMFVIAAVYNANLSLLISNGMPQPNSVSLETLIKNGEFVGFQNGSFVFGLLKQWGFHESKLKAYATEKEYAEALLLGSHNNGVSAIIDEIPYIRAFLTHYGNRYAMGSLRHKTTGGWGFIFSKGSKIAQDFSDAILQLDEDGTLSRIMKRWFEPIESPNQPQTIGSFKSLSFHDFLGLFLIIGPATGVVLLLPLMIWLYKHKRDLMKQLLEKMKILVLHWYDS